MCVEMWCFRIIVFILKHLAKIKKNVPNWLTAWVISWYSRTARNDHQKCQDFTDLAAAYERRTRGDLFRNTDLTTFRIEYLLHTFPRYDASNVRLSLKLPHKL